MHYFVKKIGIRICYDWVVLKICLSYFERERERELIKIGLLIVNYTQSILENYVDNWNGKIIGGVRILIYLFFS